jgi:hypothetical protein
MEIINDLLLKIFILENSWILTKLNDLLFALESNALITALLVFFLLANIHFIFKKEDNYNFIFLINSIIFFIILILFPLNIPFTDTYNELNLLFSNNIKDYILSNDGDFLFSTFRVLHTVIYKYFNLNYYFIIIFNFLLFILSFYLIKNYLEKIKLHDFIFIFILIYFSGKWFVVFFEPVNIVWTINFLLILVFIYLKNVKHSFFKFISLTFIYFMSYINFKAGIVLLSYSIIYGLFLKERKFKNLIFILVPVIILLYFDKSINLGRGVIEIQGQFFGYILQRDYFALINNFLATHLLVFTLSIFPTKIFAIIIVIIQYFYLINLSFFNGKKFLINLRNLILQNPFLIIGIMGCLLINLIRIDYNQSRYFSFSLLFQIGFFIFYLKNNNLEKIKKKIKNRYLISSFLCVYVLNLFIPHQGFLFAFEKNLINKKVKNCFIDQNNENDCLSEMFYLTFYDEEKISYKYFKDSIFILEKQKLSIFNEIHNK